MALADRVLTLAGLSWYTGTVFEQCQSQPPLNASDAFVLCAR